MQAATPLADVVRQPKFHPSHSEFTAHSRAGSAPSRKGIRSLGNASLELLPSPQSLQSLSLPPELRGRSVNSPAQGPVSRKRFSSTTFSAMKTAETQPETSPNSISGIARPPCSTQRDVTASFNETPPPGEVQTGSPPTPVEDSDSDLDAVRDEIAGGIHDGRFLDENELVL